MEFPPQVSQWQSWTALGSVFLLRLPYRARLRNTLLPTHVEVAVHVEANDAEVVGSGNIRDDALSASALFGHPHPHVPVPELGAWKMMKVKRFGAGGGLQPTPLSLPGYLFRCGPLGLQLLLVQGLPEHPAQPRHGLHTVQQRWVLSCVFISLGMEGGRAGRGGGLSLVPVPIPQLTPGPWAYLVIPGRDTVQAVILLQQVDGLAQETERGRVQGFREGQGQMQSHSDAGRAGDGTQESRLLVPSPRSPTSPPILSTLYSNPNTCHPTFPQAFPPLLS